MAKRIAFFILGAFVTLAASAMIVKAQPASSIEQVEKLFKGSGYTYDRRGKDSNVFVIDRDSRSFFFSPMDDAFVGGVVVAEKGSYAMTTEALTAYLRVDHKFDFVKLLIDDDGDLSLRVDAKLGHLDQKDFNDLLNRLITSEKQLRTDLKDYIRGPGQK